MWWCLNSPSYNTIIFLITLNTFILNCISKCLIYTTFIEIFRLPSKHIIILHHDVICLLLLLIYITQWTFCIEVIPEYCDSLRCLIINLCALLLFIDYLRILIRQTFWSCCWVHYEPRWCVLACWTMSHFMDWYLTMTSQYKA